MPEQPSVGDQELEVLRFIAEKGPLSVGEAAKEFGEARGLARTTILTMMERLRKKGYLSRTKEGGAYRYTARIPQSDVLRGLVADFIEKTLGGSLSPFVAYLADAKGLSAEELADLRRLVEDRVERGDAGDPDARGTARGREISGADVPYWNPRAQGTAGPSAGDPGDER